jgi:hypothetical protein
MDDTTHVSMLNDQRRLPMFAPVRGAQHATSGIDAFQRLP